jgi:ATP-dependent DNA helicase RecG
MYQPYQVIEGMRRVTKYPIPIEAFREALANAVVHRDYLYKSGVQIAMFDNRIEIRSPGGLPEGVTEEMYYANLSSEPRNPILADVFKRLGIIEKWGTGVKKIIDNYKKENSHPSFKIEQTQITVILPVLNYDYTLLETNRAIMAYLGAFPNSPRSDIEEALKIEKTTLIRKLNELLKDGEIISNGRGPTVTYNIK